MNAPNEVAPYLAQDAKPMPLAGKPQFSLAPRDLAQAIEFAGILSKSSMVPKEFVGNPGNILVAVQWGMELGLQPMQAMQNIAVINGRPSLWGDAVIGIVKASPACEYVVEEVTDTIATCRVKRRGEPEQVRTFTMDDAKKAGLQGKQGPWTQYPKRMMQMRARSWALRDVFPDVLRGMPVAEEVMDYSPTEREINVLPVHPLAPKPTEPQPWPADRFAGAIDKHSPSITNGSKTANDLLTWMRKQAPLTAEQEVAVLALQPTPISGDLMSEEEIAAIHKREMEEAQQ